MTSRSEVAASEQLLAVIQDDVCKSLLQASRTENVSVPPAPATHATGTELKKGEKCIG